MANKVKKGYPLKQVSVRLKLSEESPLYGAEPVNTPQKAVELVAGFLGEMDREHFIVIPLDAKLRPLNFCVASIGTAHQSIVDSPTVFKEIFLSNGFAYLTAHNHPSGDPAPSMDDYRLTKRLMEQSEILGISYFDHVIIGAGGKRRFSFREEMGEAFSIQGLGKALEGMGDSSRFTFVAEGGIPIPVLEVDERGMVKPQRASVREKIQLFKGALAGQGENALETAHDIPQPLSPMEAWERDVLKSEKDSFLIYQLKGGEETRYFRFEGLKYLFRDDVAVDKGNYDFVYAAPLPKGKSLEDIYMEFNDDCPEDYTGSSLSVSDIVALRQNGENRAFYTDSIGFTEIPHFFDKELTPKEFSRERMAYAVGNFFIALQKGSDGIAYSAYDKGYGVVLESVYERSGATVKDAILKEVLPALGVKGQLIAVDYGCLMERVEKTREVCGKEADLTPENSQPKGSTKKGRDDVPKDRTSIREKLSANREKAGKSQGREEHRTQKLIPESR